MKHQRAFTLLEVLIALAILAIVLTAAFRGIGMVAGQAAELGERHAAQWVAQNKLAQHRMLDDFPDPASIDGTADQAGFNFKWHEDIKPTDNVLFRRIDVKVFRADGTQLARITGFASRAGK